MANLGIGQIPFDAGRTLHHVKRGSMDTHYFHDGEPQNRHSRHSVDSTDLNAVLCTAEPSEAADIAGAFRRFVARFLSTRTTALTTK